MSKHYISPKALCPFYRHEHPQMVYCDGVTEDSVTHEAFVTKAAAVAFKNAFCRNKYTECPIYEMLRRLVEDD